LDRRKLGFARGALALGLLVLCGCETGGGGADAGVDTGAWELLSGAETGTGNCSPFPGSDPGQSSCGWRNVGTKEVVDFFFESADSVILISENDGSIRLSLSTGLGEKLYLLNGKLPSAGGDLRALSVEAGADGGAVLKVIGTHPGFYEVQGQNRQLIDSIPMEGSKLLTTGMWAMPDGRWVTNAEGGLADAGSSAKGHYLIVEPATRTVQKITVPGWTIGNAPGFGVDAAGGIWTYYSDKDAVRQTLPTAESVTKPGLVLRFALVGQKPGGGVYTYLKTSEGKGVLAEVTTSGEVKELTSLKNAKDQFVITKVNRVRHHQGYLYLAADNGFWRLKEKL
jgi:hypothetical protein